MPMFDPEISKTKLWIAFKEGGSRVYYSLINYDNQSKEKGMRNLIHRFVKGEKFMGKYNCAILYDNLTGKELKRFNECGIEL